MHISAVELDTGLTKDNLRTWERRYGFPQPSRDGSGDRVYSREQVEKLRLIRRLMDVGFRPGALMNASLEELRTLGVKNAPRIHSTPEFDEEMHVLLNAIQARNTGALRARLRWQLARLGIRRFVIELIASLNEAVGDSWARGDISIAEEHLYSEQIEAILRSATNQVEVESRAPRVLLTTLPGEQHKIGLLMLEALLSVELVSCVSLGTQTPIGEIVETAVTSRINVVALSFSSVFPRRTALNALTELRTLLPERTEIWAGGNGVKGARKRPKGILVPMTLLSVLPELQRWKT